jgi:hypothetical protein
MRPVCGGDREDIEGRPLVGPTGRILEEGLKRADIAHDDADVTEVVKRLRYRQRGNRRIHQRPDRWHTQVCLPWRRSELAMNESAGPGWRRLRRALSRVSLKSACNGKNEAITEFGYTMICEQSGPRELVADLVAAQVALVQIGGEQQTDFIESAQRELLPTLRSL